MNKILQTLSGVAIIALVCFLLVAGRAHSDWFYIALAGIGGFLISKSLINDLITTAAKLLPWKNGGAS